MNFDINFIYDNCIEILNKPLKDDFIDTMRIARRVLKNLKHHRLFDLANFYDVDYSGAHRALNDCKITQECYCKLQETILNDYKSLDDFINQSYEKIKGKINISEIKSENQNFDENQQNRRKTSLSTARFFCAKCQFLATTASFLTKLPVLPRQVPVLLQNRQFFRGNRQFLETKPPVPRGKRHFCDKSSVSPRKRQ